MCLHAHTTTHTLNNLYFAFFSSLSSDSLALSFENIGILLRVLFLCALLCIMPTLNFYLTSYAFTPVFYFRASLSVVFRPAPATSKKNASDMQIHPTPNLRKQTLWIFSTIMHLCVVLAWTCALPDSALLSVLGFTHMYQYYTQHNVH